MPFDQFLLSQGVHRTVALHLFEAGEATLAQAATLAGLSVEGFVELLGETGIPAVSYSADELADEVEAARCRCPITVRSPHIRWALRSDSA